MTIDRLSEVVTRGKPWSAGESADHDNRPPFNRSALEGASADPALIRLIETIGVELTADTIPAEPGTDPTRRLVLILSPVDLRRTDVADLAWSLVRRLHSVHVVTDANATTLRLFDLGDFRLDELSEATKAVDPLQQLGRGGEDRLVAQIARRSGFGFIALTASHRLVAAIPMTPAQTMTLTAVEVVLDDRIATIIAPPIGDLPAVLAALAGHPPPYRFICVTTPKRLERRLRSSLAERTERGTTNHLAAHQPAFSAKTAPSWRQKALIVGLPIVMVSGSVYPLGPLTAVVCAVSALAFLGLAMLRLNAWVGDADATIRPVLVPDADLPSYTVMAALYREANMLPQLVAALSALDYPSDRLDIMLLVEDDDRDTQAAAVAATEGRPQFRVIVVPQGRPRTKPRALVYGLAFSRASLVTVYDAEDRPQSDQLKVAASALVRGPPNLACVQARLEIVDAGTWLQQQFLIEYAYLFSGILPWLARAALPLPLGGTSNHFKRRALTLVGGWDPYNVTEDADLGVRLARFGLVTGVVDSVTHETAPSTIAVWLRQRRRWIKGWLMTALVHGARFGRLHADLGSRATLVVALHLAANILSPLLYPVWTVMVAAYCLSLSHLPQGNTFAGSLSLVAATAGLVIGFGSTFLVAAKALDARHRHDLMGQLATMPIYWLLSSWAAWSALVDILVRPHAWAKTPHAAASATPDGAADEV